MWILPKQLHTSAFVPDMAALISGSEEQSQICAQSLFLRSKPSLPRTWSQKWKRDSWTQLLSGRILKPSLGQSFVTAWTSSLEVIPVSHSLQLESGSEKTTQDTSGLGLQMELFPCDPESSSSRMSKDISVLDSERSLKIWKDLVTTRRGEYSLRVKSAHLTKGNECLSWPTVTANEDSYRIGGNSQQSHCLSAMARRGELGLAAQVKPSTDGSRLESWATPSTMDHINVVRRPEERSQAANKGGCKNLREEVHQWATPQQMPQTDASWPTPAVKDVTGGPYKTELVNGQFRRYHNHTEENPVAYGTNLKDAVRVMETWATPRAGCPSSPVPGTGGKVLEEQVRGGNWATPQADCRTKPMHPERLGGGQPTLKSQTQTGTGKLNPRWVETLMGLPVGWTMPSCSSPLTIELTNCDCSEMESSQQLQPELF